MGTQYNKEMQKEQPTFDALPVLVVELKQSVQTLTETMQQQQRTLDAMQQSITHTAGKTTDRWLDLDGLIDYLPEHPKRQTVYQWVSNKQIPCCKTGNRLRFRQSTIDGWLESGRHKTAAELQAAAKELQTKQSSARCNR